MINEEAARECSTVTNTETIPQGLKPKSYRWRRRHGLKPCLSQNAHGCGENGVNARSRLRPSERARSRESMSFAGLAPEDRGRTRWC